MDECKTCASCRESKPPTAFNRDAKRKDGLEPYCRSCRSAMYQGLDPRKPDPNLRTARPCEKLCSRCKESKPPSAFNKDRNRADGLFPYCRDCKQGSDRRSHARHKVRRNTDRRDAYATDDERRQQAKDRASAAYYADREAGKRRASEWALANPARRHEIRLSSDRRRYAEDPEPKREAWRRRHAKVRRGCRVYGITKDQLAAKVAYWGHKCWICSGPYDSIDHVKPLAKKGPHMVANLRPVCTPCNTRKRDRWPYAPAA